MRNLAYSLLIAKRLTQRIALKIILSLALALSARANNPSPLTGSALQSLIENNTYLGTLKKGFHFNQEAPNMAVIDGKNYLPQTLKKNEIKISWVKQKYREGRIYVYICDDAKTFCEPRTILLEGSEENDTSTLNPAAPTARPHARAKINRFGFIEDDYEFALTQAKRKNQLVLIDFYGRWCPGCVRLETEVIPLKSFQSATQDLIKLKLDIDHLHNFQLREKYKVRFIPTLIITNSDGDEILRLIDFQPEPKVLAAIDKAKKNQTSLASLLLKIEKSKSDTKGFAVDLAERLFMAGELQRSIELLRPIQPRPALLSEVEIQNIKQKYKTSSNDKFIKKELKKTLAKNILREPESTRSLRWRADLAEITTSRRKRNSLVKEGLTLAQNLLQDKLALKKALINDDIGEFTDFEALLVSTYKVNLLEKGRQPQSEILKAKEDWISTAQKLNINSQQKGMSLRLVIYLIGAKKWDDAENRLIELLKHEPNNPELKRRLLRVYNGQKKFSRAAIIGRELLGQSYGQNEVWVALQLAQALQGLNKINEAQALARTYLQRVDIDWTLLPKEKSDFEKIIQ